MNLLFLCGCCEPQHEAQVTAASKAGMGHASMLHQRRLIEGLQSLGCSLKVISAPFIGAWPVDSSWRVFRGFAQPTNLSIRYVPFHNLWGWRNISRTRALRKPVDRFLAETAGTRRAVAVYAPHTPFLLAAVRAKRKAPDLHICLIVPDLPQYMNLNAGRRRFYDFCKFFDLCLFDRLNRDVDSYLLLTEPMVEALHVEKRPYMVSEGLSENGTVQEGHRRGQSFVYAGKLIRQFGVKRLLEAFAGLQEPEYRLIICGDGEMRREVENAAAADERIHYLGSLQRKELQAVFQNAGVLVNPRTSRETYTRYSFPSKIIEYLQTGLPVVGNWLEGMPCIYRQLLYCPKDDSASALMQAMQKAMHADKQTEQKRLERVKIHLRTLAPSSVAGRLLDMLEEKAGKEC